MNKNILNEKNYINYLINYNRGKVISEQQIITEQVKDDYDKIKTDLYPVYSQKLLDLGISEINIMGTDTEGKISKNYIDKPTRITFTPTTMLKNLQLDDIGEIYYECSTSNTDGILPFKIKLKYQKQYQDNNSTNTTTTEAGSSLRSRFESQLKMIGSEFCMLIEKVSKNEDITKTVDDIITKEEESTNNQTQVISTGTNFSPENGGSVKISCLYGPGYYSLKHTDNSGTAFDNESLLNPVIAEAAEFLKTNAGWIPKITITSGESIIPNNDSEGGTGSKKVGWLSTARKNKIEAYINLKLKTLKVTKPAKVVLLFQNAKTITKPSAGWSDYVNWRKSTPEEKKVNPKNTEYTNLKKGYDIDQFTEINFSVVPDLGKYQCTLNVKIGVHYDFDAGHHCDDARFQILANGVVLTTGAGTTVGSGKLYADMNNGGGQLDIKGKTDVGGFRYNYFKLDNKELIKKIMAADTTKMDHIRLTSKCVPNTVNNNRNGGCHKDVPHITVNDTDGLLVLDTYPKSDDAYLVTVDKCGKWVSGAKGLKPTKQSEDGNKTKETNKLVGRKLDFAAPDTGTVTSEQAITTLVSNETIQKNPNGTYTVLKTFGVSPNIYKPNDIIVNIKPWGTKIIFP